MFYPLGHILDPLPHLFRLEVRLFSSHLTSPDTGMAIGRLWKDVSWVRSKPFSETGEDCSPFFLTTIFRLLP